VVLVLARLVWQVLGWDLQVFQVCLWVELDLGALVHQAVSAVLHRVEALVKQVALLLAAISVQVVFPVTRLAAVLVAVVLAMALVEASVEGASVAVLVVVAALEAVVLVPGVSVAV